MQLTFFDNPIILENDKVKLVPLAYEHIDLLWPIADDPEIWQMTPVHIKTIEQFGQYVHVAMVTRNDKTAYAFLVIDKATKFTGRLYTIREYLV